MLESVYQRLLRYELEQSNLAIESEVSIPVRYKGQDVGEGFRADLMIERKVIVELKSVEVLTATHAKQLLTYLKLSNCRLGLLLNFNVPLMRDGIRRLVNGLND